MKKNGKYKTLFLIFLVLFLLILNLILASPLVKKGRQGSGVQFTFQTVSGDSITSPIASPENINETDKEITASTEESNSTNLLTAPEQNMNKQQLWIYFIKEEEGGMLALKGTTREVISSKTPLTQAINQLLLGPNKQEISHGRNYLTFIPEGTVLLNARIQNSVAFLNFNDAFGSEGYSINQIEAQLKQVIFTATEFSSINSVQILIDGQIEVSLSSEGGFIGVPLGRNNF